MQSAPYGSWRSPITAALISAGATALSALSSNGEALFWLETRPTEGGRNTLMCRHDDTTRELTPAPFNVRTRVHEYGGGSYLATREAVYFVDFRDQGIYRLELPFGSPVRLTEASPATRYADFAWDGARQRLLAVCEQHGAAGTEPTNTLVAIDAVDGGVTQLHGGHDFYAAPRLAPDGERLCFVSWDHPNMPWDGSQLHVAEIAVDGTLGSATIVAGGAAESITQPQWIGPRRLLFASDASGFWNLYSYDDSGIYCVFADEAEYAGPAWTFASRHYVPVSPRHVVARRVDNGAESLSIIDIDQGIATPLPSQWTAFDALTQCAGETFGIASRADRPAAIVRLATSAPEAIVVSHPAPVDARWFGNPEVIEYPTRDGAVAYAYFYPPHNPDFTAPPGELPPLLVISHGGPTAATRPTLNLRVQYYCSRGWAVVDVNYRGSTGYGRAYRSRLDGNWGIVDVHDCEDAVAFLTRSGRVDADRVAIRGGSAGGFTTLAALTTGNVFRAGASHYGIGDLETLVRDTHKFESRYLERLVGPYPAARDTYRARSPIHHIDRLQCPVVLFQGLEDRVVPPNQAQAMAAALRRKGLPVAYVAFPGEQHGFRQADNIRRAIEGEYLFFARVFGFDPADPLQELVIENLPHRNPSR